MKKESSNNKYSDFIMYYLRQRYGLNEYDYKYG